mgnify:CR=1 FL=1
MIFDNFKKYKEKIALISEDNKTYSYKDILEFKESLKKKFKKRSLTVILSDNSVESVLVYISLVILRIPILLLNSNIRPEDLNVILKNYQIQQVLSPKKIKFKNRHFLKKDIFLENFIFYKAKIIKDVKIHKQLMIVLPSSGTISESKLIKLSYKNYYFNTESIIKYLKISKNDRSITTMPLSYSYGLSVINSHLMAGGSMVVGNFSLLDKKFWTLSNFYKLTNINGVPFFYDMFLKIGLNKKLSNKIKFFTVAGGQLNLFTFKKLSDYLFFKKIKFFLMYGQTEASPRISYHLLSRKDLITRKIPAGKAIPGTKIYLHNKKNQIIKKNNVEGEVIFKGPNIFGGYASNIKDLSLMKQNKYLRTGDLGIFNNKKILCITGRKSRIVKIYGYRINLDQLESKINKNKIKKVACLAKNEKIYIFTEKKINLLKFVDLPNNSFKVVMLKKFPKTENGKISYKELNLLLKND